MQTFVVRLFLPAEPEPVPLCGLVERVGSRDVEVFESADGLIRLLEAGLRQREPRPTASQKGEPWTSTRKQDDGRR